MIANAAGRRRRTGAGSGWSSEPEYFATDRPADGARRPKAQRALLGVEAYTPSGGVSYRPSSWTLRKMLRLERPQPFCAKTDFCARNPCLRYGWNANECVSGSEGYECRCGAGWGTENAEGRPGRVCTVVHFENSM